MHAMSAILRAFMPDDGVLQVRTQPTTDSPTYCTTGWTTGWKVLHP